MSRDSHSHPDIELLSSYVDGELDETAERRLERHLATCTECGDRLQSMRRVALGLQRLPRALPPPELAARIRRETAEARPTWLDRLRGALMLPARLQTSLATAASLVLALVLSLWIVEAPRNLRHETTRVPQVRVDVMLGGPLYTATRSEVAGREFVLKNSVWIERGLEGEQPDGRIDVRSPEGRELLSRFSEELGFLLEDGSRVMLRYRQATVELSAGSSS